MSISTESQEFAVESNERMPVVVVGAGAMGRSWIRMLASSPHARLVGLVDLDLPLAERAVLEEAASGVIVGTSLEEVVANSGAEAVINVTVPQAHRIVNETALLIGLPVLCEKPIAETLPAAIQQVALADVTGGLIMVSQSRRYFNHLSALRQAVSKLGALGTVTTDFFHADHEPGFREQMLHPLLVDMSIHHFDALRHITGHEPLSVQCSAWNPSWSWYASNASATAVFELTDGVRYVYAGSRCSPGLQTSWNGSWHVYGEHGAAHWDGDHHVEVDAEADITVDVPSDYENIAGSLAAFVESVRNNTTPENEIRDNIASLAMVEAAALSAASGERVVIADLLAASYAEAIATERRDDVRERLAAWGSVEAGLSSGHWGTAALARA
ncbi:putative dehydrogenase [Microterricola gilva]|uniref:Putative dehydrogenase n=1 Tax=Microterricola gilva TaxID=393267 RepID=A0A4Q8AHQ4_9MICO|nr:Gfo/Idh/MocA family oxidoreductase [Microterricola gilva]RZU63878.1 putative dehydrogenase [Microterricola gilva]